MNNAVILMILSASIILVNAAPYLASDFGQILKDEHFNTPNSKDGFDLILTLLPLYGWVKVSYLLKQRTIDQIYVNFIFYLFFLLNLPLPTLD